MNGNDMEDINLKSREKSLEVFLLLFLLIALAVGILYAVNDNLRGFVQLHQCTLNTVTGLLCPACGGTRAVGELLSGNLLLALRYNPLVITILPVVFYALLTMTRMVLDKNRSLSDIYVRPVWMWLLLVISVLFMVARNLPQLNYLWFPFY